MRYVIKIVSLALIPIIVCSLSGCSSNEVKEVTDLIDSIGEVSILSKDSIDDATNAYNSLSPKDKKKVKNIDTLYAAQKDFEKFVPEYIFDRIALYGRCEDPESLGLKEFVNEYFDQLTEYQIEVIACAIGKTKIEDLAIEIVKESMKNPDSFELIEFNLEDIIKGTDDNTYCALLNISFRGTNSFGGVVPDNWSGAIYFVVDFDNCTISYSKSISY